MYYRQKEYMLLLEQKFSNTEIYEAVRYKEEYDNKIKLLSKSYNSFFERIIDKSKEIYGFDLNKVYRFNYAKYYLWRKEFCHEDEEWMQAALSFVCLSCLADLIFDSNRLEEKDKQYTAKILTRKHFEISMNSDLKLNNNNPMESLYNIFIKSMKKLRISNPQIYHELSEDILKAFESEIYISTNRLIFPDKIDMELLTSKSIEFVSSCLYMAAVDTYDLKRMKKCAFAIAKLFWIIDDICDLYDDIGNSIKNSLLFLQKGEVISLENSIDFIFENINVFFEVITDNLEVIKINLPDDIYKFFLYELYDWVQAINIRMDE